MNSETHYRYLITGVRGSIGKYLLHRLPDAFGLHRDNFSEVANNSYDTIIHCAFNKGRDISNDRQYLEDNILLTQRIIQQLSFDRLVYLSSVDVHQDPPTPYSLCKRFAEALVADCEHYTILRSSTLLGPFLLPHNHLARMLINDESIGLSADSSFNYILGSDLLTYFASGEAEVHDLEIIDFVSNGNLTLDRVKTMLGSTTQFGDFRYAAPSSHDNPLFRLNPSFFKTSEENLGLFLKNR